MGMDEVLPDVFVGGTYHASRQNLDENSIKTVLTIKEFSTPYEPQADITHHFYKMEDMANQTLSRYFPEIIQAITDGLQRGRVLVHCQAGMSRSVSGIICYMISTFNIPFDTALAIMRSNHPSSIPNPGFREQLHVLYSKTKDTWVPTSPAYIYHRDKILEIESSGDKKFHVIAKILKAREDCPDLYEDPGASSGGHLASEFLSLEEERHRNLLSYNVLEDVDASQSVDTNDVQEPPKTPNDAIKEFFNSCLMNSNNKRR